MTAAQLLARRNELLAAIAAIDTRLVELADQEPTNRVVSEFRYLADMRGDLSDELRGLNAEPPPLPFHPRQEQQ